MIHSDQQCSPRGLLFHHGDNAWYHVSSRGLITKLRQVDLEEPALTFRLPEDEERLREIAAASDVYSVGEIAVAVSPHVEFPSRGFPHDERAKWLDVAELLMDVKPASLPAEVPLNPVPTTGFRRFYDTLRLFPTKAVHGPILDYLARDMDAADILDAPFADSLLHLNSYRNLGEPFRPKGFRTWWPEYVDRRELW